MKNKLLTVSAALVLLFAGSSVALAASPSNSDVELYASFNVSRLTTSTPFGYYIGSDEVSLRTAVLAGGVKFNQYFATEVRVGTGISSPSERQVRKIITTTDDTLAFEKHAEFSQDITFGIYAKGMYPLTDAITIYGLLGYAHGDTTITRRTTVTNPTTGATTSHNFWQADHGHGGLSYGVGVSFDLTDHFSIRADYIHLYDWSNSSVPGFTFEGKATTFSLGVTYSF